jgi:hypothetical protein
MATALCVQFSPQLAPFRPRRSWDLLHIPWFVSLRSVSNRIAQGQQGRPIFAFSFEEDEEQTQEEITRETQCGPLILFFINTPSSKKTSFGFASLLLRGAGALFEERREFLVSCF